MLVNSELMHRYELGWSPAEQSVAGAIRRLRPGFRGPSRRSILKLQMLTTNTVAHA